MTALSEPIVHTLNEGGSDGIGMSFWSSWIFCGMRAWLDSQMRSEGSYVGDDNLLLGSIYHAFHEIAAKTRSGSYDTGVVEFAMDGGGTQLEHLRAVAETLYRAHRVQFPYGKEGRIETVEETVRVPMGTSWLPEPNFPLAIKPDQVRKVLVQHSMWIRQYRNINVAPGRYIVDFKTDGGWNSPEQQEKYHHDVRFKLYILAWNAAHPKTPVNGVLVDIAYKPTKKSPNRKPDFDLILVKPEENDEAIVRSMLALAKARHDEEPPQANPFACWNYGKVCPHLVAGRCGRFTQ
jgi:hypothetical protein